jgi:ABC-type nitrate/sulfonate/bicarbonate transport system permease component
MTDTRALAGGLAADTGEAPGRSLRQRLEPAILGTIGITVLLLVWEVLPRIVPLSAGTKLFFTTPSQIVGTLWRLFATGAIWGPLGVSASGFAIGLGIAIVVGLPLGVLIGRSRTLNDMLDPFITAFNATPRLVFLPLVMLWFGLGLWTKVIIVFIGALFPILINTYEGVRNADRTLLAVGRAVLGVVVAEYFGSESGLGVIMVQAAGRYQVDVVFSGLIVFAALSLALTAMVQVLENRLSLWRPQKAGGE